MLLDQLGKLALTLFNHFLEVLVARVEGKATVSADASSLLSLFALHLSLVFIVLSSQLAEATTVRTRSRGQIRHQEVAFALAVIVEELFALCSLLSEPLHFLLLKKLKSVLELFDFGLVSFDHVVDATYGAR